MSDDPAGTYKQGETWYERPGCHHVRSENVSDDPNEEAVFYAVIVIDDATLEKGGMESVFVLDADKEERK